MLKETSVGEESEPREGCRTQVRDAGEQGADCVRICKSFSAFTLRWKAIGKMTYFMI